MSTHGKTSLETLSEIRLIFDNIRYGDSETIGASLIEMNKSYYTDYLDYIAYDLRILNYQRMGLSQMDTALLWSTGSCDGPMSGIFQLKQATDNTTFYYGDTESGSDSKAKRIYLLYPLNMHEFHNEHKIKNDRTKAVDRNAYLKRKPVGFTIDYDDRRQR